MRLPFISAALALGLHVSNAAVVERQSSSQYTYVDLSVNTGATLHRASGVLYGVPDGNPIPSTYYTGMGFNYLSAGGAQYSALGWIYGGYTARFQDVLSNYNTARSFNAQFILKMSELWGADGTQQAGAIWPYDNSDWAEYDRFLTQLVADLKANSMTANTKLLIWNEPDSTYFWEKNKANLSGAIIAGPAMAGMPNAANTWWTSWLAHIAADGTAPDIYTWHLEGSPAMVNLLNQYKLTIGEFVIDEYGVAAEQVPGGAAWWISRFERYNMYGLRGNWASGADLQDYLAELLYKSGSTYYPNGEYQVYKYYATNMVGYRVQTTGSTDRLMDCYAVVDSSVVRILVGGRQITGTYQLQINNLSALGLATSGTISVTTLQFSWTGATGQITGTTSLGAVDHTYSGNVLSFPIYQGDTYTTWAFEFSY